MLSIFAFMFSNKLPLLNDHTIIILLLLTSLVSLLPGMYVSCMGDVLQEVEQDSPRNDLISGD